MENKNESLNEDIVLEEEELEMSEDIVEDESEDDDSITLSKSELTKMKRKALAYEAMKAKQAQSQPKEEKKPIINNTNNASIEETVLKAQGIEEDELDMLKKVATISGTGLIDAQKDEVFKLWKQNQEATKKAQRASMGASKGSGSSNKKDFNTPGLSEAEFKQLWKEKMQK